MMEFVKDPLWSAWGRFVRFMRAAPEARLLLDADASRGSALLMRHRPDGALCRACETSWPCEYVDALASSTGFVVDRG